MSESGDTGTTLSGPTAGPVRPRRLRRTPGLRALVRETRLSADDLVLPLFVTDGAGRREPVPSMPGVERVSVDLVAGEALAALDLGIRAVLLFGVPDAKDPLGLESHAEDAAVQRAVRVLAAEAPDLVVVTDVCMCEYTDHGHCGLLDDRGRLLNDETLEALGRIAVSHADAGADVVAPSGMIDGMVAAIRAALDEAGHAEVAVLSYAVKYASAEPRRAAPDWSERAATAASACRARPSPRAPRARPPASPPRPAPAPAKPRAPPRAPALPLQPAPRATP